MKTLGFKRRNKLSKENPCSIRILKLKRYKMEYFEFTRASKITCKRMMDKVLIKNKMNDFSVNRHSRLQNYLTCRKLLFVVWIYFCFTWNQICTRRTNIYVQLFLSIKSCTENILWKDVYFKVSHFISLSLYARACEWCVK